MIKSLTFLLVRAMRKGKKPPAPDRNQKKITQFFVRPGQPAPERPGTSRLNSQGSSSGLGQSLASQSSASTSSPPNYTAEEGEIVVLTPPPKPPAIFIELDSSGSEDEGQNLNNHSNVAVIPPVVCDAPGIIPSPSPAGPSSNSSTSTEFDGNLEQGTSHVTNEESLPGQGPSLNEDNGSISSDSADEILSQIDIDEVVRLSQSPDKANSPSLLQGCPSNTNEENGSISSDSADEILSQIDIDEVVRLSQSPDKANSPSLLQECPSNVSPIKGKENVFEVTEPTPSTSAAAFLKSPRKSPKSQINKFSPIRHLKKRSSSQASLDSSSPPKNGIRNGDISPNSKRRLQFDSGTGMGGGPYYLRNFMSILNEVIGDKFHAQLLNDEDHKTTQKFSCLSQNAQCLYVRLFQRKFGWKPVNKLKTNYKELPGNLTEVCKELCDSGFFENICATNSTLEEVLDTLDLAKMNSLAKKMMITSTKKSKESLKEGLLAKVKTQKTLSGACGSIAILKSALSELGPAVRISLQTKTLFSRLFILHSPPHYWEVEQDQASNQLLVILLNSMGQMEYATYKIKKSTQIYETRADLINFHNAFSLHSNLVAFSESKDYQSVVNIATEALELFEKLLEDKERVNYDTALPTYLRIFTAGSVLFHTCWMGVDGFQKLKKYSDANKLIYTLLGQPWYLPNYRGRCWERLAINATHLKQTKEDVKLLLEEALRDKFLKHNHKLILSQRLEKITQSIELAASKQKEKKKVAPKPNRKARGRKAKKYIDDEDTTDDEPELDEGESSATPTPSISDAETQVLSLGDLQILTLKNEIPSRTIIGEKMDQGPGSMGKSMFIGRKDATGSNRISSVEQHAINYYLDHEGFTNGIHGEGSTISTIYGLLFWEIIFYDELPDTFYTKYQGFPLDLHSDDFYHRRKDMIDEKLVMIRDVLSIEDLWGIVEEVWTTNEKKLSIVSWSLFEENLPALKSLMKGMGTCVIAKLCERLSKNYRYYASGFPDVVVWNDDGEQGKVLFAEVKGPGDTLSAKQQLWLDFLVDNGIPAEVCHVKSVSNKRIRLERNL